MKQNSFIIVSQLGQDCHTVEQSVQEFKGRSPRKSPHRQIPLFNPLQPTQDYPLTIELLPEALQWWDEVRYLLVHKNSGLRVPGSFNEKEARKIQEVSKDWDWTVDSSDRRVACGMNLLALAEVVCSRSSQQGGES